MVKKLLSKLALISIMSLSAITIINCIFAKNTSSDSYAKAKSVKLSSSRGSCSGEQIVAPSGTIYILTAGHCKALANDNNSIIVETEDHLVSERRIIAEDPKSDLLLLEGIPKMEGLNIAKVNYFSQKVRTFTHGKGFSTYKTEGELIQIMPMKFLAGIIGESDKMNCFMEKYEILSENGVSICLFSAKETVTTAQVVPGSSGGMVVDELGQLVGVVSASDGMFGYLVTLKDIHEFLAGY